MVINANVPFMGPTGITSTSTPIQILKQKERVLDHVLFEMYMFLWTTKRLKELLKDGIDWENSSEYNAYYIAQIILLKNVHCATYWSFFRRYILKYLKVQYPIYILGKFTKYQSRKRESLAARAI